MYKKIQYDDVVRNIIIYEYNSIINILTILYLHLMMRRYENLLQEEKIKAILKLGSGIITKSVVTITLLQSYSVGLFVVVDLSLVSYK
jgi:hypothetical protein